jgi:hypothetical protein
MNRACLSGKDLVDLLEGKPITVSGVEFVYDGLEAEQVLAAAKKLVYVYSAEDADKKAKAKTNKAPQTKGPA